MSSRRDDVTHSGRGRQNGTDVSTLGVWSRGDPRPKSSLSLEEKKCCVVSGPVGRGRGEKVPDRSKNEKIKGED